MMGRELFLIPPLGGMERKLAEIQLRVYGTDDMPGFVGWCPDSTCVVVTDSPGEDMPDALVIVSLETGQKRQLTNPQRPLVGDTQPAISPDGRWLAFRRLPNPTAGELYLLPLGQGFTARGEPRRLTLMDLNAEHPAWMPDSKEILVSTGPRTAKALSRIAISGDNVAARIPFVGEDGQMPALSLPQMGRPVRLVYVRSFADANIWLVETRSPGGQAMSSPSVAIASTRNDIVGDFSPDGRHVVFASQRSGKQEIWRSDPDGSNPLQLTFATGSTAAAPRWSPKGESIVFQSNLQGQFDIHVVPSSGGKPRRITSDPATDVVPSFSRDGSWIYFSSNRTGDWQIWKVRSAGGDPVQVTRDSGFISRESLDGNHLYYMVPGSPAGLWRIPTAGGEPVKLLEGEIAENFDVVEKGIYYVDWLKGEARLQFFDFSSEKSAIVARNLGDVRPLLTATPDGRTILYTRLDSSGDDLMLVENFR
jgi:Tol biopolymer transport system component